MTTYHNTSASLEQAKNRLEESNKIRSEYDEYVLGKNHPCVMAQTVFKMDNLDLKIYDELAEEESTERLIADLENYVENYDFESNDFHTFMAVFKNHGNLTEIEFENLLWKQLQMLHEKDEQDWNKAVSDNPEDENFSFSLAGKAFYIVGLHPNSSRMARKSPYPTIAFNLHWQFEKLREMGTYQNVKKVIRRRDKKLQGSINPVLKDFGKTSEVKQYSGRNLEDAWKCPFLNKNL